MDVLQQNTTLMSKVRKFGKPQLKKEGGAESSGLRRLVTLEQLHKTVDGYGLKSFMNAMVPIECSFDRMPTHLFLQCTKIRAAVLHNRLRSARRNPLANTTCDAGCEDVESLGHIVQNCPRTNGPRHARHDAIVRMLEARLKEKVTRRSWNPEFQRCWEQEFQISVHGASRNTSFAMWRS